MTERKSVGIQAFESHDSNNNPIINLSKSNKVITIVVNLGFNIKTSMS